MTQPQTSLNRTLAPVGGDLRLPKPPGVIRQFWYRHPWLTDSFITASYVVPFLLVGILTAVIPDLDPDARMPFVSIALSLIGGVALLFRRYRPWTVVIVAWAAVLIGAGLAWSVDPFLLAYALYALAVYRSVRAVWAGFGISTLVGGIATILAHGFRQNEPSYDGVTAWLDITAYLAALIIVVLIGINIGNRRRYVVALQDRAAQLARERDQQAQIAALAERSRIAAEMHDIVSHGLTVMVTLAEGSAATAATNPERASEAMRTVAETGRHALADMRRMLGVLDDGTAQSDPTSLAPQPGIAELGGLIEGFRAAGLLVNFVSTGTPPINSVEQLTIYRLVQESLTNVLRHSADTGAVAVTVRYAADDVTIDVSNGGPVVRVNPQSRDSGGHGIDGMRQRVALYGGTVESGPRAGGGWAVSARLQHGTSAPPVNETESI